MVIQRVSHVGICVADLERSLAFYRDLLGFEQRSRAPFAGAPVDRLLGLDGVQLDAAWLERDGTRLELLHFAGPGTQPDAAPRPMNRTGFTHLSLRVEDLDGALGRLRDAGAHVLDETRFDDREHGIAAVFVLDPDGTRIELVQMPGDPARLPGQTARPRQGP